MISKVLLTAALCVSAGFGQSTPGTVRTFTFARTDTPRAMQEISNSFRAIVGVAPVLDTQRGAMTVSGTEAQADIGEWLFKLLDVATPAGGRQEYVVTGAADDLVRVIYPVQAMDHRPLQDLVNSLRTIAEVQRVVSFTPQKCLVLRGQPWQMDMAEWLIQQLVSPTGANPAVYTIVNPPPSYNLRDFVAVRIFYLPPTTTPDSVQSIVDRVRAEARVMRIAGCPGVHAIALRGTEEQATAAARLLAAAQ